MKSKQQRAGLSLLDQSARQPLDIAKRIMDAREGTIVDELWQPTCSQRVVRNDAEPTIPELFEHEVDRPAWRLAALLKTRERPLIVEARTFGREGRRSLPARLCRQRISVPMPVWPTRGEQAAPSGLGLGNRSVSSFKQRCIA